MSGAPQQLVLDLPHRSALGAEDFLVSDCNAAAVAMIDGWPDWPSSVVAVAGRQVERQFGELERERNQESEMNERCRRVPAK